MPLDISKLGREPYQRFEKPAPKTSINSSAIRYCSILCCRFLGFVIVLASFLAPFISYDFGLSSGFARTFVWNIFFVVFFILFCFLVIFAKPQESNSNRYLFAFFSALAALVIFACSVFPKTGLRQAIFYSFLSEKLGFFGIISGFVCFFSIFYLIPKPGFVKSIFVSWFVGSIFFAGYNLFLFFSKGGYDQIIFYPSQGWPLVLAVNCFLLLSFSMFQKGIIKAFWSFGLFLHLALLFLWDIPGIWASLLVAVSFLLAFQIIYSKKLWQRNFIYPLQVWLAALILFVIPIKFFSGENVPDFGFFAQKEIYKAVLESGFSFFGSGLGLGSNFIGVNSISFLNIEDPLSFSAETRSIGNGWAFLFIESGLLGFLFVFFIFWVFIIQGIKFLKKNFESLKEKDMPESAYLGSVFFLAILMILVGFWFSPFTLFSYIFVCFVFAGAEVFWSQKEAQKDSKSSDIVPRVYARLAAPFFIFVVCFLSAAWFFYFGLNFAKSAFIEKNLKHEQDQSKVLLLRRELFKKNPWNKDYAFRLAFAEIESVSENYSLDDQKQAILRVASIVNNVSSGKVGPIEEWLSALAYKKLAKYAEGSSAIAREHYVKAADMWPKNLALPVVIAKFYAESAEDIISSSGTTLQELKDQSRVYLRRSIELEPNFLPAIIELALIDEEEKDPDFVIGELLKIENLSPEVKYHIGRIYFNKGDIESAAKKFSEVIEQVPTHSNSRYSLGIIYFRMGKYNESLSEFEEVLRLNPGNLDVEDKINQVKNKIGI